MDSRSAFPDPVPASTTVSSTIVKPKVTAEEAVEPAGMETVVADNE